MNPNNRYPTPPAPEPEEFHLRDVIWGEGQNGDHPLRNQLVFVSSYRGTCHYTFFHPTLKSISLTYRYAKDSWRTGMSQDGRNMWNFPNRDVFEREVNSSHNILHIGNEPADELTLQTFQAVTGRPNAKTGFYCHLRNRFVSCKPSKTDNQIQPSHKTWDRRTNLQVQYIQSLLQSGQETEAIQEISRMPTFLEQVKTKLKAIIPNWEKMKTIPNLIHA